MKTCLSCVILGIMIGLSPCAFSQGAAPTNAMVINPGMEEGTGDAPVGWTLKGKRGKWDATRAHAGKRSLMVSRPETTENARWISAPIMVKPGTYRLSAWLRGDRVRSPDYSYGVKLYVIEMAADGKELVTSEGLGSNDIHVQENVVGYNKLRFDWTYCEKTLTFGKDTASVLLSFGINGSFGPTVGEGAWLDDVRLAPVSADTVAERPEIVLRRDIVVNRIFNGNEVDFRKAPPLHGVFRPGEAVELVIHAPEKREDTILRWAIRDGWNILLAEGTQKLTDEGARIAIGTEVASPFRWLAVEARLDDASGTWARRVVNVAVIPDLSVKTDHPFQGCGPWEPLFPLGKYLGMTVYRHDYAKPSPGITLFGLTHLPRLTQISPEQLRERIRKDSNGLSRTYWQLGNEVPMRTKTERELYRPLWTAFVDELKQVVPDARPVFGSLNVWDGATDVVAEGLFDDSAVIDLHYLSADQIRALRLMLDKKYGAGKKKIFMTEIGIGGMGTPCADQVIVGDVFKEYAAKWCAGADVLMWCNFGGHNSKIDKELKDEMEKEGGAFVYDSSWTPHGKLVAHAIMVDRLNGMKPVESKKLWISGNAWLFNAGDRWAAVLQGEQQAERSPLALKFAEPVSLSLVDSYGRTTTLAASTVHTLALSKIPVLVSWRGPVAILEPGAQAALCFTEETLNAPAGGRITVDLTAQKAGEIRLGLPKKWSCEPDVRRVEPGGKATFTVGMPQEETAPEIRLYAELADKGEVSTETWITVKRVPELQVSLSAVPVGSENGPAVKARVHNFGNSRFEGRILIRSEGTRHTQPLEAEFPLKVEAGRDAEAVMALDAAEIDLNREWGYRSGARLYAKDGHLKEEIKTTLLFRSIRRLPDDWKIDAEFDKYADQQPVQVATVENFFDNANLWKGSAEYSVQINLGYNERGLVVGYDIVNLQPFMDPDWTGNWIWKNDSYELAVARHDPVDGRLLGMVKITVAYSAKGLEVLRARIDPLHGYDGAVITDQVISAGKVSGGRTMIEMLVPWEVMGNPPHGSGIVLPVGFCGNKNVGDGAKSHQRTRVMMSWGGMLFEPSLGGGKFAPLVLE
ncbi:MAG: hypothetical protein WAX69_17280 [Victivallales bacterium]